MSGGCGANGGEGGVSSNDSASEKVMVVEVVGIVLMVMAMANVGDNDSAR